MCSVGNKSIGDDDDDVMVVVVAAMMAMMVAVDGSNGSMQGLLTFSFLTSVNRTHYVHIFLTVKLQGWKQLKLNCEF
jgi:hypothetical protein